MHVFFKSKMLEIFFRFSLLFILRNNAYYSYQFSIINVMYVAQYVLVFVRTLSTLIALKSTIKSDTCNNTFVYLFFLTKQQQTGQTFY